MRKKRKLILLLSLLLLSGVAHAQKFKARSLNLRNFDDRPFHYGMQLGAFTSTFRVEPSFVYADSLGNSFQSIWAKNTPGFSVGFVFNTNIAQSNWDLRFLPTVSLYERNLTYTLIDGTEEELTAQQTLIELPLMLKYKSRRRNNHRMFIAGGFSYSRKVGNRTQNSSGLPLPLQDENLELVYGTGIHLYLKYFRFSPEIRIAHGLSNLHQRNFNEYYAKFLSKLLTHKVSLIFNFEG